MEILLDQSLENTMCCNGMQLGFSLSLQWLSPLLRSPISILICPTGCDSSGPFSGNALGAPSLGGCLYLFISQTRPTPHPVLLVIHVSLSFINLSASFRHRLFSFSIPSTQQCLAHSRWSKYSSFYYTVLPMGNTHLIKLRWRSQTCLLALQCSSNI